LTFPLGTLRERQGQVCGLLDLATLNGEKTKDSNGLCRWWVLDGVGLLTDTSLLSSIRLGDSAHMESTMGWLRHLLI
jgi:hypothetical protein